MIRSKDSWGSLSTGSSSSIGNTLLAQFSPPPKNERTCLGETDNSLAETNNIRLKMNKARISKGANIIKGTNIKKARIFLLKREARIAYITPTHFHIQILSRPK